MNLDIKRTQHAGAIWKFAYEYSLVVFCFSLRTFDPCTILSWMISLIVAHFTDVVLIFNRELDRLNITEPQRRGAILRENVESGLLLSPSNSQRIWLQIFRSA